MRALNQEKGGFSASEEGVMDAIGKNLVKFIS